MFRFREKRKKSDSVLWQKPLYLKKCQNLFHYCPSVSVQTIHWLLLDCWILSAIPLLVISDDMNWNDCVYTEFRIVCVDEHETNSDSGKG